MAEDNADVIRRSLDAVDQHRRRLLIGLGALMLLLLGVFMFGAHGGGSDRYAILSHYFMLLIWVTALTLVVVIQITVMTKRILRAIELAMRK